jgi:hypothetical protein
VPTFEKEFTKSLRAEKIYVWGVLDAFFDIEEEKKSRRGVRFFGDMTKGQ